MHPRASIVRDTQGAWARANGIEIDAAGYTNSVAENMFDPLSAETLAELSAGDGSELGRDGKRGKIQALHSSSALACNVFEYWRTRIRAALESALGLTQPIDKIQFERKFPTGLPGNPPNMDITLTGPDASITAIECKFLEPYGSHSPSSTFKAKYFESDAGLWRKAGYAQCQTLAEQLYRGEKTYRWLNAEQLLKHILGLSKSKLSWRLFYLWYDIGAEPGQVHAEETADFERRLTRDGIPFSAITYQTLYKNLRHCALETDSAYLSYLSARYFHQTPN